MSGFVLHPGALTDLDEIWEFIAADNVTAANRVSTRFLKPFVPLYPPEMGHARPELTSHPLPTHCASIRYAISWSFMLRLKSLYRFSRCSTAGAILVQSPPFCEKENAST